MLQIAYVNNNTPVVAMEATFSVGTEKHWKTRAAKQYSSDYLFFLMQL